MNWTRRGFVSIIWRERGVPMLAEAQPVERVITSGGRGHDEHPGSPLTALVRRQLTALIGLGLGRVAHGAARGGDRVVDTVASQLVIAGQLGCVFSYPLSDDDWARDSKAGHTRNDLMLEREVPSLVLAHPDPASRGTWHCITSALERGMTVSVRVPRQTGGRQGVVLATLDGLCRYTRSMAVTAKVAGQQITMVREGLDERLARVVCATLALADKREGGGR